MFKHQGQPNLIPYISHINIRWIIIFIYYNWLVPDAVDTVICVPDDGWRNHPKHLDQFTDNISYV